MNVEDSLPSINDYVMKEESITDRFRRVEADIATAMKDKPPIHPIIVIQNERVTVITIYEEDGNFVISSIEEVLYSCPVDTYRLVLFEDCSGIDVQINTKLCRVSLHNCVLSRVVCHVPLIGPLELYRCIDTQVHLPCDIPVLTMECSRNIDIHQREDECMYCMAMCIDVTIYLTGSNDLFKLGKLLWSENERQILLASRRRGLISTYDVSSLLEDTHILL